MTPQLTPTETPAGDPPATIPPPPCEGFQPCEGLAAMAVHIGGIDREMAHLNANLAILIRQVQTIGSALGIKFAAEALPPTTIPSPPLEGMDAE
jgi:hypothetical protein